MKKIKEEPPKSAADNFAEAQVLRNKVSRSITSFTAYHEKEAKETRAENAEIFALLEMPKSKENFNKIRKVFDKSTLRTLQQDKYLKKEVADFKFSFLKMFNSYSYALLQNHSLGEELRKELLISVLSLAELATGYEKIKFAVDEGIETIKRNIKSTKFPSNKRALQHYLKTKKLYSDMFAESIFMMQELERAAIQII